MRNSMCLCGLFFLSSIFLADCQTLNQSKTLMSSMLAGYDKRHRPVVDQSKPINVNVTFDIVSIQDFDEVDGKLAVVGVLYLTWVDESIKWDPYSHGGIISQLYGIDDVWYPILILANPYNSVADIGDDWMTVRIYFNGFAFFAPGAVFKSTCSVDVTYYPFDTQICTLLFIPWGFSSAEMSLLSTRTDVLQSYFSDNGEWTLTETGAVKESSVDFDSITFTFKLKRKPLFFVINVILPIVFMTVINLLVFVLPVEAGERMSYAVTVLLAIAVFLTLVADNLPKTSKPMSILCYFLMIILIISTLISVVTIWNLKIYFTKKELPVPQWCRCLTKLVTRRKFKNCFSGSQNNTVNVHDDTIINVIEMNNSKKSSDKVIAFTDNGDIDNEAEVTWQDVSSAIDIFAMILFMSALIICTSIYMSILVNNSQYG